MTLLVAPPEVNARAVDVFFDNGHVFVRLANDRIFGFPRSDYPRLATATPEQLGDWRLIGGGQGIHWPQIDEDISVERVVAPYVAVHVDLDIPSATDGLQLDILGEEALVA